MAERSLGIILDGSVKVKNASSSSFVLVLFLLLVLFLGILILALILFIPGRIVVRPELCFFVRSSRVHARLYFTMWVGLSVGFSVGL